MGSESARRKGETRMTLKQLAKEAEAAVLKAQMREEWEAQMREDAFGSR